MTVRILVGDVRARLKDLAAGSVQTVVTSPPYWGLRDYGTATWADGDPACDHKMQVGGVGRSTLGPASGGHAISPEKQRESQERQRTPYARVCGKCGARRSDEQIGLEASPAEYLRTMVGVFREIRRVLRDDGTCWVNMGDSYANDTKWGGSSGGKHVTALHGESGIGRGKRTTGLKAKDLIGIPWRLAFALQDDGWWLRQDIVWAKPNPMPESVRDRCTKAHEYLFLLAKSEKYFIDMDAIAEECSPETHPRLAGNATASGSTRANGGTRADRPMKALAPRGADRVPSGWDTGAGDHRGTEGRYKNEDVSARMGRGPGWRETGKSESMDNALIDVVDRRNKRSVWTIGSEPFREAHFATFPTALVEPCILAGTSAAGCCQDCGAPWTRTVERQAAVVDRSERQHEMGRTRMSGTQLEAARSTTTGWRPTCICGAPPGIRPGDLETIESPASTDDEPLEDPSLEVGRAGMARPRRADEGVRPMTRYEQANYARQLRAAPPAAREQMAAVAGAEAYAHYERTDRSGARAIPEGLLEAWIDRAWIERAAPPPTWETRAPVPCTVLDPFGGSGTTALVAERHHRDSVLVELNEAYAAMADRRIREEAPLITTVVVHRKTGGGQQVSHSVGVDDTTGTGASSSPIRDTVL